MGHRTRVAPSEGAIRTTTIMVQRRISGNEEGTWQRSRIGNSVETFIFILFYFWKSKLGTKD